MQIWLVHQVTRPQDASSRVVGFSPKSNRRPLIFAGVGSPERVFWPRTLMDGQSLEEISDLVH